MTQKKAPSAVLLGRYSDYHETDGPGPGYYNIPRDPPTQGKAIAMRPAISTKRQPGQSETVARPCFFCRDISVAKLAYYLKVLFYLCCCSQDTRILEYFQGIVEEDV